VLVRLKNVTLSGVLMLAVTNLRYCFRESYFSVD